MSEAKQTPPTEQTLAPVIWITTGRLLVTAAAEVPAVPADVPPIMWPVANIQTGKTLEPQEVDAWEKNGDIADKVPWSWRNLPDNVVPLEAALLRKKQAEVKAPAPKCRHLPLIPKPVPTSHLSSRFLHPSMID